MNNLFQMNTPAQSEIASQLLTMMQNGQNPIDEIKKLREKVRMLEGKRVSSELESLEDKLKTSEEGKKLLEEKKEGIFCMLIKFALNNPHTSSEMQTYLDEWKEKAESFLKKGI